VKARVKLQQTTQKRRRKKIRKSRQKKSQRRKTSRKKRRKRMIFSPDSIKNFEKPGVMLIASGPISKNFCNNFR